MEPNAEKLELLIDCLNKNLEDYHDSLMGFGNRELIAMAGTISSMSDAHFYLTEHHEFDGSEIDFLLKFQNPLNVVADFWAERNLDMSDMSFALENIFSKQDAVLEEYPLMSDREPPSDKNLRRFMNVDLIDFLGQIAEKTIIHYPNDWQIDIKALFRIAKSGGPEDKRLMWHVSSYGTHLNTERDTFIMDTGAFNTWVEYRPNDPDMFGYAIEILGYDGGKVFGNVYEVGHYAEHAKHIRDVAEPLESLTLVYSNDWGVNAGKAVTVSRKEYDNDRRRLMSESGNVKEKICHPKDKVRLAGLIAAERKRRRQYLVGSTKIHLQKLTEKLAGIRKPPEKPAPKREPSALADKIAAAREKVNAQNPKPKAERPKREERD